MNVTFEDRLIAVNFRPSGFDYMRLILAVSIVVIHSILISYGDNYYVGIWVGPLRPLFSFILPVFFALSGFLVAGSFDRCRTLVSFGGLRVLRLVPALLVDTAISALILGPIFTTIPLTEYFSSPLFSSYFLNIAGWPHYFLPGVFADNPAPNFVNLQLWTLPYELRCYLALAVLALLGVAQRPRFFLPFVLLINVILAAIFFIGGGKSPATTVTGSILVLSFLYGIAGFLYRKKFKWDFRLFIISVVLTWICLSIPGGDFLVAIPAAYLTIYVGLTQPKRNFFVTSGDYSYGIFLYGYPVQQAMMAIANGKQEWYENLLFSLPLIAALAIFSWHFVEKPVLKFRQVLMKIEDAVIKVAALVPGGKFVVPSLKVKI